MAMRDMKGLAMYPVAHGATQTAAIQNAAHDGLLLGGARLE
jgi:hypothetical protein